MFGKMLQVWTQLKLASRTLADTSHDDKPVSLKYWAIVGNLITNTISLTLYPQSRDISDIPSRYLHFTKMT
jgi:hypothetical protein